MTKKEIFGEYSYYSQSTLSNNSSSEVSLYHSFLLTLSQKYREFQPQIYNYAKFDHWEVIEFHRIEQDLDLIIEKVVYVLLNRNEHKTVVLDTDSSMKFFMIINNTDFIKLSKQCKFINKDHLTTLSINKNIKYEEIAIFDFDVSVGYIDLDFEITKFYIDTRKHYVKISNFWDYGLDNTLNVLQQYLNYSYNAILKQELHLQELCNTFNQQKQEILNKISSLKPKTYAKTQTKVFNEINQIIEKMSAN